MPTYSDFRVDSSVWVIVSEATQFPQTVDGPEIAYLTHKQMSLTFRHER